MVADSIVRRCSHIGGLTQFIDHGDSQLMMLIPTRVKNMHDSISLISVAQSDLAVSE